MADNQGAHNKLADFFGDSPTVPALVVDVGALVQAHAEERSRV